MSITPRLAAEACPITGMGAGPGRGSVSGPAPGCFPGGVRPGCSSVRSQAVERWPFAIVDPYMPYVAILDGRALGGTTGSR